MSASLGAILADTVVSAASRPPRHPINDERFLWGAATAGHQVEGQNVNSDFWFLEHVKGSILPEKSGDACDQLNRFAADIRMLAAAGLNTFRFSVEWSRVQPELGEFSRAALDHYRRVAATCREHGVTPFVTLNHFTTPRWFAFDGGWENSASSDRFATYCDYVVKGIGDLTGAASTLNEPNVGILLRWVDLPAAARGAFDAMQGIAAKGSPTGRFSGFVFADQEKSLPNLLAAHRKGYAALKAGPGDFPVGVSLAIVDDHAVGPNSQLAAKRAACYEPWLQIVKETGDFIGVQTYTRARLDANGPMPPPTGAELTQIGDEFYPEAIGGTIRYAYQQTGKPVYVTENGIPTTDDSRRVAYIERALAAVGTCIDIGIPVRGYIHWSLLDNYEWGRFDRNYGLVAVDRSTQKRTPRPSLNALGDYARGKRSLSRKRSID